MIQKLMRLICLNRSDACLFLGVECGLFVLLHGITCAVLHFSDENTSLLLSGAVLPCTGGFLLFILVTGHIPASYSMGVQFGETRKNSFLLLLGIVCYDALCAMLPAVLFTALEHLAAPRFWQWLTGAERVLGKFPPVPEIIAQTDAAEKTEAIYHSLFIENFTLPPFVWLGITVGAVLLGLIVGTLLLRFGSRSGPIIMFVWLGALYLNLLWPGDASGWLLLILPVMITVAFLWSVWYLLHMEIRNG